MGGPCDAAVSGSTEKEVMDAGWAHMESAHPEMIEDIKAMPQEDKDKWAADFHATWEATPEDEASEATEDVAPEAESEMAEEEPAA